MSKNIKVNDSFIVNALRNCGYNNYSALADIIDNSLEPEVNSTYVKVDFETEGTGADKTTVKSILVIDDGCGMTDEVLEEAMSLGSETGKNGSNNLGMYGAGMKTASFSIGQILEVYTKDSESDSVNYATISLEDEISNNGGILVDYAKYGKGTEEYEWFNSTVGADHGTIVKISHLDRLSNGNFYSFKGTLENKISETFNKYIYGNVVSFYVGKNKVKFTDLTNETIGSELIEEGEIIVDGNVIKYRGFYLPSDDGNGGMDEDCTSEKHIEKEGVDTLPRTRNNQGLYIYRQNRLVGKAIVWGMWTRDYFYAPFRCEIFINGNCDYLFGSTFTKMIGETSRSNISQELWDKLSQKIKPIATEVKRRVSAKYKADKKNNPEEQKKLQEFYKQVTDKQNNNMMLRANRSGSNKPKNGVNKEHHTRGPQKNPNPIKIRSNKWLDGFEERPLGVTAEMYGMERGNNKRIIVINTDHPFYQKFYSRLDNDLKFTMAQIISCEEIAKQNVNYYGAEEVQQMIDAFNEYQSSEVRKSLCF